MSDDNKKNILEAPIQPRENSNTGELSWAGKLFFASIASYILNQDLENMKSPVKIKGTPEQIQAIVDTIKTSKQFQQELNREDATIDSVIDKLQLRNLIKSKFFDLTGKNWPI